MVTVETLKAIVACSRAIEAFQRVFPDGAESLEQAAAYASWVDRELGMQLIEKSDSPKLWCGKAAARAHWWVDAPEEAS